MKYLFCLITLLLFISMAGCELPMMRDMPHADPEPEAPEPVVIAGPYFSSVSPDTVSVCFTTDIPTLSGVRLVGSGFSQVRRMSLPRRVHSLEFKNLLPGHTYRCDLLIDGEVEISLPLRTFPEDYNNSSLVFIAGGASDPGYLASAIKKARSLHPDAIIFSGGQIANSGNEEDWISDFLAPYNENTRGMNLLHAPDLTASANQAAQELFPAITLEASYAVTIGNIKLIMIAPNEMQSGDLTSLIPWLKRELMESETFYKVVMLPRPILMSGNNGIVVNLLYDLAPIFEEQGVAAVISTSAPFYHRSLPIGSGVMGVNYLALANSASGITPQTPSDYTAAQNKSGAILFLRSHSGRLEGRALGIDRSFSDSFILADSNNIARDEDSVLDRDLIVSSAWARASQIREVNAIARQASRAVKDPANPGQQRFVITNPSPKPFRGSLSWLDTNSAFTITPKQINFDLSAGEAIVSVFTFKPGEMPKRMPILTVECDEIPSLDRTTAPDEDQPVLVSQPLLLTEERKLSLPRTEAPMIVDGRADEDFWKKAVAVGAFTPMNGEVSQDGSVMAKLIAGPEGLRVRLRCTIPENNLPPAMITTHDGQVWKDESVEIFIDPFADGREFFQFSLNTSGTTLEANSRQGIAWNADWKQAVDLRDNRYNVEIVIPYEALGLARRPAPGTRWGINLTRNDNTAATPRILQAAPTHGSNARAGCYLKLTFK